MSSASRHKPAGIQDIAQALGISIGTVDRALHNRAGISSGTREKVLRTAARLGYKPNTAARNLKLNRRLHLAVILPREVAGFFDQVREGIRSAAAQSPEQIQLSFFDHARLGKGDLNAIRASHWKRFDGLILAPSDADALSPFTAAAAKAAKPIVFVATDASRLQRTASVATDALVSGSIAAEFLGISIRKPGAVAVITGSLRIEDHAEKLRGFAATLATLAPHLTLLPAIETHESASDAARSATRLLQQHEDLAGIYINTANSLPILKAVRERKLRRKPAVITTDLFPELIPFLEDGLVTASLHQRPFTQGRLALEALQQSLTGTRPKPLIRLAPHIVLRSNLSLFTQSLEHDGANTPTA